MAMQFNSNKDMQGYNIGANPVYSSLPETPPGLNAIPYLVSGIANGVGTTLGILPNNMVSRPYVSVNQSTYDAQVAQRVMHPAFRSFETSVYGQFGEQIANTIGMTKLVDAASAATGYSAEQLRRDMSAGGGALGRSFVGQLIAPMADQLMAQSGITGGSIIESMNAINRDRMNLLGGGVYFNPLDSGQMHKSMGAASAMMLMTNGLMSQQDEKGRLSLLANNAFTKGFNREDIAAAIMKSAGKGLFTSSEAGEFAGGPKNYAGSFEQQLSSAAGDYDIAHMSYDDLTGTGDNVKVDSRTAERMRNMQRSFTDKSKSLTEALGAMRDLSKSVETAYSDLEDLTNGEWNRSANNLQHARDTAFKLKAVAQTYNLDPEQAINLLRSNRDTMQTAAGVTDHMRMLGLNGGGMFGFAAQTAVLQDIEDKITASGARGDPVAEARLRYQGINSLSRSVNTSAGRASQLLAYGLQTGVFNDEQAARFREGLLSGDRSVMGESINKMLVTMFGSAETGRKMMNDTQFMQAVRMGLTDKYGAYANKIMIGGAHAEMAKQEMHTIADQRLNYSKQAIRMLGMDTRQTAAGVDKIVDSVSSYFNDNKDPETRKYGELFREQVATLRSKGYSADAALNATIRSFKDDPETSRYASMIDLQVKRASAVNNENRFSGEGALEGAQANALLKSLTRWKDIDGKTSADVRKMLKEGRGAEALSKLQGITGSLSASRQKLYSGVQATAKLDYERNKAAMEENTQAEQMLDAAMINGYGGEAISSATNIANEAAATYFRDIKDEKTRDGAKERFWESFSKSKYSTVLGEDAQSEFLRAVESGDVNYIKRMGRVSLRLKQMATEAMGNNGWDLTYTGFFNSGKFAGNSEEAAKARDALTNNIAANLNDDSTASATDRDTLSQNIVGFLTGTKNIRDVLKLHDKDGKLTSKVSKYLDKNDEFLEAQKEYESSSGKYSEAITALTKEGRYRDKDLIDEILKNNPELSDGNIEQIENALDGFKGKDAILDSLKAKQKMQKAQNAAQKELGDIGKEDGTAEAWKNFEAKKNIADARKQKEMTRNEKTFEYMDSLDLDLDSLNASKGKTRKALLSMFRNVTNEEVAKKANVSSVDELDRQSYAEAARSIIEEKARAGDESAMDVVKQFRAAEKEQSNKITGELTIKNGNEQATAVLEANIGGGLS